MHGQNHIKFDSKKLQKYNWLRIILGSGVRILNSEATYTAVSGAN